MTYNLTNLTNAEYGYELLSYANEVTAGVFVAGFVISLYIVFIFVLNAKYDFLDSLIVSSFLAFLVSSLFVALNLLAAIFLLVFLLMTGLLTFFKIFIIK